MNEPKKSRYRDVPEAISPPYRVDFPSGPISFFSGPAVFTQNESTYRVQAEVRLELLSRPQVGFRISPLDATSGEEPRPASPRPFAKATFDTGKLRCEGPVGGFATELLSLGDGELKGLVGDQHVDLNAKFTSAKLLVFNGPRHRGTSIHRDGTYFLGRLTSKILGGGHVTLDRIGPTKVPSDIAYGWTDVAEIRFPEAKSAKEFESVASQLFHSLSLMKGGWVGVVGPWYYRGEDLIAISPSSTKASLNTNVSNWHHHSLRDGFEELFGCLQRVASDPDRREAMQTAIHWLVESQQCAGGIEGSLILQQAALEALSWYEVVQKRHMFTEKNFDEKKGAYKRIRLLLDLFQISAKIPPYCVALTQFAHEAEAVNEKDLLGLLLFVRDSFVHNTPKKIRPLLARAKGDDERIELWHLTTGLLEMALLAVAGYSGRIFWRDRDVEWAVAAIGPVPWTVNSPSAKDQPEGPSIPAQPSTSSEVVQERESVIQPDSSGKSPTETPPQFTQSTSSDTEVD